MALDTSSGAVGEPVIEIDGLHIAVFIDSLWRGNGVRELVDGFNSTLVLILGRFSADHKPVRNSLRAALRERGYTAIMLDTDLPSSRDTTETIQILARFSRFVIADVTDPRSAPHELQQIVPFAAVPTISVSPGQEPFSMAVDNERYPWVLPARRYSNDVELHDDLDEVLAALERTRLDVRSRAVSPS